MLCVDETKLDSSFPDSQFKIDGYTPPPPFPLLSPPYRRDRDNHGGGNRRKNRFCKISFDYKKTGRFRNKTL